MRLSVLTPSTRNNPVCEPDNADAKSIIWVNNNNDCKHKHGPLNNNWEFEIRHSILSLTNETLTRTCFLKIKGKANIVGEIVEATTECSNAINNIIPVSPTHPHKSNDDQTTALNGLNLDCMYTLTMNML